MKASEAQIFYTPAQWTSRRLTTHGEIEVLPLGEAGEAWDRYAFKVGACYGAVQKARGAEAVARVLLAFQTAVVRDGLDPQVAHRAFMKIDEYRDAMPPELERLDA